MMTPNDQTILEEFARSVRGVYPEARIYAYGSRVRGDGRKDSDLDICVVIKTVDQESFDRIVHLAWEVGFERGMLIAPVIFSSQDFEQGLWAASSLVQAIREEGLAA